MGDGGVIETTKLYTVRCAGPCGGQLAWLAGTWVAAKGWPTRFDSRRDASWAARKAGWKQELCRCGHDRDDHTGWLPEKHAFREDCASCPPGNACDWLPEPVQPPIMCPGCRAAVEQHG